MATIIMSMAARSSDLEDQRSGVNLQTGAHTGMESQCWKDPEEMGKMGSSLSCSSSWSPGRGLPPNHPNIRYCLGILVTLTKETGAVPPLSHTWTAPLVEDMLHYARTGLAKAMVKGPGRAVLFYGRHSLRETLSPDEFRDATFVLKGVGTWVCTPAYLTVDPLTIQEGQLEIARVITKCQIKDKGPWASTCESVSPTTIQMWPTGKFTLRGHSHKCLFRPQTIILLASKGLEP